LGTPAKKKMQLDAPVTDREIELQAKRTNLTILEARLLRELRAARRTIEVRKRVLLVHRLWMGSLELYGEGMEVRTVEVTRWQDSYRDKLIAELGPEWVELYEPSKLIEWNRAVETKLPVRHGSCTLGSKGIPAIKEVKNAKSEGSAKADVDAESPPPRQGVPSKQQMPLGKGCIGQESRQAASGVVSNIKSEPGRVGRETVRQDRGLQPLVGGSEKRPGQPSGASKGNARRSS
jgi:hypothetical protein